MHAPKVPEAATSEIDTGKVCGMNFKVKWEIDAKARSLLKAMSEEIDGYQQRTRKGDAGNSDVEFGDHLEAKFLNGILVR